MTIKTRRYFLNIYFNKLENFGGGVIIIVKIAIINYVKTLFIL